MMEERLADGEGTVLAGTSGRGAAGVSGHRERRQKRKYHKVAGKFAFGFRLAFLCGRTGIWITAARTALPQNLNVCMSISRLFPVLLLLMFAQLLGAQTGNPARADTASLRIQFDQMLDASNRFQTFKVIRQDFLGAFITNVTDSLRTYNEEIGTLKSTISDQEAMIEAQTATIGERDTKIKELTEEKDGISLLGLPLSKITYNIIMWSAIILLLAALLFAIARMRFAISSSREARSMNEKTAEELEKSRKNRLEVEQKLRRQLQDERNKQG